MTPDEAIPMELLNTFDMLLLTRVVYPNIQNATQNISQYVKNGGFAIIACDNPVDQVICEYFGWKYVEVSAVFNKTAANLTAVNIGTNDSAPVYSRYSFM